MKHPVLKNPKIFYGWWIVGTIFLISAYSSGIIFYGFTAIMEPLINEFGWSYAEVSVAASLRGLETGLLAAVVGFLIDRFGPRKLIFTGAVIIGLGLLLLSGVTSLWMFYTAFLIISTGMSSSNTVVTMTVVSNWFHKKVSLANGIATCGSAFGGLLVPLVTRCIDVFQWRTTMVILAVGMFVIVLPLSFLVRHKPEQYGYLPDGDKSANPVKVKSPAPLQPAPVNTGVKQVMRSRIFWMLTTGFTCHALAAISVVTHVMPYLGSIGIPKTTSSLAVSGIALAGILGRFSFGWLGDRYDKRIIIAAAFGITVSGLLLFSYVGDIGIWSVMLFSILFGFGFGAAVPLTPAIIIEYFGRNKLGSILGLLMGLMMIGGLIGPPLTGWVYDSFRDYRGAWFAYAAIVGAGMICILTLPSNKSSAKT